MESFIIKLLALLSVGGGVYYIGRRFLSSDQSLPHDNARPVSFSDGSSYPSHMTWTPPPAAAPYLDAIRDAERTYNIPHNLLARLIQQESNYKPDARNTSGALGIAQFMHATAIEWGVDRLNAYSSIDGAGRYLEWLYGELGSWRLALAAYNWGIGNVQRKGIEAAPRETRNYVTAITHDVPIFG